METTETAAVNDAAFGDCSETRTCVVLGGRGFLGRTLVNRLLRLGGWIVRVADSSSHSLQLDPSDSLLSDALCSGQASFCHVDVRDTSQIIKGKKIKIKILFIIQRYMNLNIPLIYVNTLAFRIYAFWLLEKYQKTKLDQLPICLFVYIFKIQDDYLVCLVEKLSFHRAIFFSEFT